MLEFIFFHPLPTQHFVDWLNEQSIPVNTRQEDESYLVEVPEDLDEALYNDIEAKYAELLEMNEAIMLEENNDNSDYHMAGIVINLENGGVSYADVDPKLLGKVMQSVTPEEFSIIVDAIVTAVEHPQGRSYCQRQRDAQD